MKRRKASDALTAIKVAALLPSNPENFKKGFLFSGDWWGPNLTKATERFNEWRLS